MSMEDCDVCKNVVEDTIHEVYKLVLHITARVLFGQNRNLTTSDKKERNEFVLKVRKYVSALRNSGGGVVFVHIEGLCPEDRCLDKFHQLLDEKLNLMIEDGSLFVNIYKKDWYSEDGNFKDYVALTVLPCVSVVTVDYKTKLPLDSGVVDPSNTNILKILKEGFSQQSSEPHIRGFQSEILRESRHCQVKSIFDTTVCSDVSNFVNYIFEKLHLMHYVTAFSKLNDGGSIYFGIKEEPHHYEEQRYTNIITTVEGFKLDLEISQYDIIRTLQERVESETTVLRKIDNVFKFTEPQNLVKAEFHRLEDDEDDEDQTFILEVAVAGVSGVVFYDPDGPEAYEILSDNKDTRIQKEAWIQRQVKYLTTSKLV